MMLGLRSHKLGLPSIIFYNKHGTRFIDASPFVLTEVKMGSLIAPVQLAGLMYATSLPVTLAKYSGWKLCKRRAEHTHRFVEQGRLLCDPCDHYPSLKF